MENQTKLITQEVNKVEEKITLSKEELRMIIKEAIAEEINKGIENKIKTTVKKKKNSRLKYENPFAGQAYMVIVRNSGEIITKFQLDEKIAKRSWKADSRAHSIRLINHSVSLSQLSRAPKRFMIALWESMSDEEFNLLNQLVEKEYREKNLSLSVYTKWKGMTSSLIAA